MGAVGRGVTQGISGSDSPPHRGVFNILNLSPGVLPKWGFKNAHHPFVLVAKTFSPGSVHAASRGWLMGKAEKMGQPQRAPGAVSR